MPVAIEALLPGGVIGEGWPGGEVGDASCTGQFTPQQDDHTTGGPVNKSDGPTYFGLGAGVSEVEVDVLTGEVAVLRTDLLYDCGQSLNPQIDIGQAEGGFVMGQGFFLQARLSPLNPILIVLACVLLLWLTRRLLLRAGGDDVHEGWHVHERRHMGIQASPR